MSLINARNTYKKELEQNRITNQELLHICESITHGANNNLFDAATILTILRKLHVYLDNSSFFYFVFDYTKRSFSESVFLYSVKMNKPLTKKQKGFHTLANVLVSKGNLNGFIRAFEDMLKEGCKRADTTITFREYDMYRDMLTHILPLIHLKVSQEERMI